MSPLTKIILSALTSGLIAAIVFVGFSVFGTYLYLRNLEIFFLKNPDPFTSFDGLLFLLCLLFLFLSLAVCPYAAYRIRNVIFAASSSFSIRVVLFCLVASSQIIFLSLGCFFVLPPAARAFQQANEKPDAQTLRQQANDKITQKLNAANIEVVCKKAKIISDGNTGGNIVAKFTLQIKNVPAELSAYEFQISAVNEGKSFQLGSRELYGAGGHSILIRPLNIEAVNENGEWIFYQGEPQKSPIGNAGEFSFQLDFYRENSQDYILPATLTPELKIRPKTKDDYLNQRIFFKKPIPVNFRYEF